MANTLYWGDNTSTPSHYEVAYSTAEEGVYSSLGTTSNTTMAHSTGVYNDWYKVRAIYQNGTSEWSLPFQSVVDPDNRLCIIFGYLRDLDVRYAESGVQDISATPARIPGQHLSWDIDVENKVISNIDGQGYFQLRVSKHTPIHLSIPQIGYEETVMVPSASSTNFKFLKPFKYMED